MSTKKLRSSNLVIGLSGFAGSGKGHIANFIQRAYGDRFSVHTLAFADPLKDMIAAGFSCVGADEESLWGSSDKRDKRLSLFDQRGEALTVRRLLQTLGTAWGRECLSENVWVDLTIERIRQSVADAVIVTDVRFFNEKNALLRIGGRVWFIDRPDVRPTQAVHVSEQDMLTDNFIAGCTVISNRGSLAVLEAAVRSEFAKARTHFGLLSQREF